MAAGTDLNISLSVCIGYILTVNKAWNHARQLKTERNVYIVRTNTGVV